MYEERIGVYLIYFQLGERETHLSAALKDIKSKLGMMCQNVSQPVFTSEDAKRFAVLAHSCHSPITIVNHLEHGGNLTNHEACLDARDAVLVLPIDPNTASGAKGFNRYWSMLPDPRR